MHNGLCCSGDRILRSDRKLPFFPASFWIGPMFFLPFISPEITPIATEGVYIYTKKKTVKSLFLSLYD